jgi:hypothetical protein
VFHLLARARGGRIPAQENPTVDDDPWEVKDYLEQYAAFEKATAEVEDIIRSLPDADDLRRNWRDVWVVDERYAFPIEMQHRTPLDVSRFPEPERLTAALAAWHEAKILLGNAWVKVPEHLRRTRKMVGKRPPYPT